MSKQPLKPAAITPLFTALVDGYCDPRGKRQYREGLLSEQDIHAAVRDRFSQFFQSYRMRVFPRIDAGDSVVEELPLEDVAFTAAQYATWDTLRDLVSRVSLFLPRLSGYVYQTHIELRKKVCTPEGRKTPLEYPLALFTLVVTGGSESLQLTRRFQL